MLGLRPFDVQLIGGVILHEGQIAEMRTGEGKTLVSVLPAFLNALTGRGVHVVTVNDYLAKRDSEWVGQVHKFLGLEVGLVQQGLSVRMTKTLLQDLPGTYLTPALAAASCSTTLSAVDRTPEANGCITCPLCSDMRFQMHPLQHLPTCLAACIRSSAWSAYMVTWS